MVILNGGSSQFKSCHYFNACACTLYDSLLSACLWSALNNSGNTHCNQNRFLAFGSLISIAEVENKIISEHVIVFPKFSGI